VPVIRSDAGAALDQLTGDVSRHRIGRQLLDQRDNIEAESLVRRWNSRLSMPNGRAIGDLLEISKETAM
jgi:hypothetical protein